MNDPSLAHPSSRGPRRAWVRSPQNALPALVLALVCGCSKSGDPLVASSPKESASQLDTAFAGARNDVRQQASAASEAMRAGDYERAVIALESVKASREISLEQGMALHGSVISLEGRLIQAIEAGDPKAKRAYELLKALKRN